MADLLPRVRVSGFLQLEGAAFVGRQGEMVALAEAIGRSRLTTVVGEAGVGKTRLALRYAAASRSSYESVWFCDLRDARDREGMSAAVARALSIAEEATVVGDAAVTAVGRALGRGGGRSWCSTTLTRCCRRERTWSSPGWTWPERRASW